MYDSHAQSRVITLLEGKYKSTMYCTGLPTAECSSNAFFISYGMRHEITINPNMLPTLKTTTLQLFKSECKRVQMIVTFGVRLLSFAAASEIFTL